MGLNTITLAFAAGAVAVAIPSAAINYHLNAPRTADTVFVASRAIDYDRLAREVTQRIAESRKPTVIDGDLIVKGRLAIGGTPESGTDYPLTIHGAHSSAIRFISNEAMQDQQRTANQHRHVAGVTLSQDGGLRLDVNNTCYTDSRRCVIEDKARRRAYTGYDSMGDWSLYLSDVDSAGKETAVRAQSLVYSLIAADGHIHISALRPGQRVFFNGSTTTNAGDLQWEVPLAPIAPPPSK